MNGTNLNYNNIFHVHTFRCKHAENINDEKYIKEAIRLGAKSIWFTDHAPFPDDPFQNRMKYNELDEYLYSLNQLKIKYKKDIHVFSGFEIEYFSAFDKIGYYQELKNNPMIDCLLLGQHMAEDPNSYGEYTFSWSKNRLEKEEFLILGKSEIKAIQTGYFDVIAHPERIFRRCKIWNNSMQKMAKEIILCSKKMNIPIEINLNSLNKPGHCWSEFWQLIHPTQKKVFGLDAHSIEELNNRYLQQQYLCKHSKQYQLIL